MYSFDKESRFADEMVRGYLDIAKSFSVKPPHESPDKLLFSDEEPERSQSRVDEERH